MKIMELDPAGSDLVFFKILFKNRRTDQIKKNWFSQKIPTKTKAIKQLKLNFTKKNFFIVNPYTISNPDPYKST